MSENKDIEAVDLQLKQQSLKNDAERHALDIDKAKRDAITDAVDNAFSLSVMAGMTVNGITGETRLFTESEVTKLKAKIFRLIKDI